MSDAIVKNLSFGKEASDKVFAGIEKLSKAVSSTLGASAMSTPTPEDFTDYAEVTKEQMVGWLEGVLDVPAMQESLNAQIELLKHPVTATLPPPFDNAGTQEPLPEDVLDGEVSELNK